MVDMGKDGSAGFDPYRYGPPAQPPAPVPTQPPAVQPWNQQPTGRQIIASSWALLKQDRELIALPLLGAVFGLVGFIALFVPGWLIGEAAAGNHRVAFYVGAVFGGFVSSVISIYFQAALVIGAYQRADGITPSFGGVLQVAWRMRRQIIGWAVFTTIVGTVVRIVEQRLGILGKIVGVLGGIAWAIASFFAVPALVAEGLGPIDALKRSAGVIRGVWGTGIRTTLRFGLIQLLVVIPALVLVGGVVMVAGGGAGVGAGIAVALIGFAGLIVLGAVLGAVGTYARAMIYRWAIGQPVPGIPADLFPGAFKPKRNRR
ncbi:DUF6159 family protein [uncultured Jatrophihabitans sp.]|uniref:DUF6159 family protein n=1 Tax=uncultured Jatrophihabitans sp. TaxID=1610747 RepID=UPI0035CA8A07